MTSVQNERLRSIAEALEVLKVDLMSQEYVDDYDKGCEVASINAAIEALAIRNDTGREDTMIANTDTARNLINEAQDHMHEAVKLSESKAGKLALFAVMRAVNALALAVAALVVIVSKEESEPVRKPERK